MFSIKRFFEFSILVFLIATFLGCATSNNGNVQSKDVIPAGYKYYPKLPSGITSLDAAKKDLAELLGRDSNHNIKYYGQPEINNLAGEEALKTLVRGKSGSITFWWHDNKELSYMTFDSLSALNDRIVVTPQIVFFYTDLIDKSIFIEYTQEKPTNGTVMAGKIGRGGVCPYKVSFPLISYHFIELADAQRFADDLYFIQQTFKKEHDERLVLFESKAAQYRALKVKPPISEEQREYIVQANALTQRQDYNGALDRYLRAVDLNPVSYPGAYFNLALLSAQMQRFQSAIGYMKQYLVLAPDAPDARSAQDKIYEWKMMIGK